MEVNFVTIHTLFGRPIQFTIPVYQRHYVWTEIDQWEPLWKDIIEKTKVNTDVEADSERKRHFTGAIVIRQVAARLIGAIPKYDIIDGQQRLTTFQIILCAIADVCKSEELDDVEDAAEEFIVNGGLVRFVFDKTKYRQQDEKYKIVPTQTDKASLFSLIDGNDHQSRGPIKEAYVFFKEQIMDYMRQGVPRKQMLSLLDSILHNFGVVQILINSDAESEKIFESINARGRTINEFDHLRNNLFLTARVRGLDVENLHALYWQHFDNLFWTKKLGTDADEMLLSERFIQHFLMAKLGTEHIIHRELFKTYDRDYRTNLSIEDELRELKKYSEVYQVMLNCTHNADDGTEFFSGEQMQSIAQRMAFYKALNIESLHPFLLFVINELNLTEDALNQVFDILESYTIRKLLCHRQGVQNCMGLFAKVIKSVDKNKWDPMALSNYLSSLSSHDKWPTDDQVKDALSRCGGSSVSGVITRYILYRIEHLKTDPNVALKGALKFDTRLTLEHVMPLNWRKHWVLPDPQDTKFAVERDSAKQSIGNLTLLTEASNKNLGDLAFADKRDSLINSDLKITKEIVCEDENVSPSQLREDWDVPDIRTREAKLWTCFCEEIWRDAGWFTGKKQTTTAQTVVRYEGMLEHWHPNFTRGIIIDEQGAKYPVEKSEFKDSDIALLRKGTKVKFEKVQTEKGVIATKILLVTT